MDMEQQLARSAAYWENIFLTDCEGLPGSGSSPRSADSCKEWTRATLVLEEGLYTSFLTMSGGNDFIIYIALMAGYKIALQQRFDREHLLIGVPQVVKSPTESNTVFLVTDTSNLHPDKTVKEVLLGERKALNELSKHQFYPLTDLYKTRQIFERVNAYCCMNTIHQAPLIQQILELAANDITLVIEKRSNQIVLELYYSEGFAPEKTLFSDIYQAVLESMFADLEKKVTHLEMVSKAEKERLLVTFNDTIQQFPADKTVHQLFEEQVERTPDNLAILSDEERVTYRELNDKANALARILKAKGVQEETIIAVLMESSLEMIVAIMGILKAGGAYLPLDPKLPAERLAYVLLDSKAKLILTHQRTENLTSAAEQLNLSYPEMQLVPNNPALASRPENLVYVIYTSGTTGKPKGVAIEHHGLVNLCSWHNRYYHVNAQDIAAKYAGLGFDASVWEIFPYLLCGAALYLVKEEYRTLVELLNRSYEEKGITIGFLPTSVFEQFIRLKNRSLKRLLTGADTLRYITPQSYALYNNYGPTENTVVSTSIRLDGEYLNIPIGKPVDNTTAYILGRNDALVPVGLPGELCISGVGLARGYLNHEELTHEKFVANPFQPGQRMYRTGDLARWLPDGNIEFLGRKDHQIKIRGFRIEPGEIESCLLDIQGIHAAVVLDKEEDGEKYLSAYYTSAIDYTSAELRKTLSKSLPEYMIPSVFLRLPQIPLTVNGKIDRSALLALESQRESVYVAPENSIEQTLIAIWSEVLKLKDIGTEHDFFELGGHSLKATIVAGRINQELHVEIPLKEIFVRRTIKSLAHYILSAESKQFEAIPCIAELQEYYATSSAQRRMYLLQELDKESVAYNLPAAIEILGSLDKEKLWQTFRAIIARHEILRAQFDVVNDVIVQSFQPAESVNFQIEEREVGGEEEVFPLFMKFIRPFDLKRDLLLRVALLRLSFERSILFFDVHHIIADGTAINILIKDFCALYAGKDGQDLKLQYKDYAVWQLARRKTQAFAEQEIFWTQEFAGEIPILNLPTDYPRPLEKVFKGNSFSVIIDRELASGLYTLAQETRCTLYMVLLAALKIVLARYTGQEDIVVGSPIAARNHPDLENMIGMFVNTLALRSTVDQKLFFMQYLMLIRDKTLQAYAHQEYPFEELIEKLGLERNLSRNPLFDVLFVLQNTEMTDLQAENLLFKPYLMRNFEEKFDLTIEAKEENAEIILDISYATALFKEETVRRMVGCFVNVLTEIRKDREIAIFQLKIISEDERKRLLEDFNATAAEYPEKKTIHQLFEAQVALTPRRVALIYQDQELTYAEVDQRADMLASLLRTKGVKSNVIVGIMVKRSPEMVIGILAILKAGGAYLPIDPLYPVERVNYMLKDSHVHILLTQCAEIGDNDIDVIDLTGDISAIPIVEDQGDRDTSQNLAYLLYTSGSTGGPKGVMIKHQSVVNTLTYLQRQYPLGEHDSYLLKTNYTFDVSVSELFGWFIGNGRLVILDDELEREPARIADVISKRRITHINFTSSMFGMFLNELEDTSNIASLKYILTAGEALTFENPDKVKKLLQFARIENLYGPTEAAIYATKFSIEHLDGGTRIPIGVPIQNTIVYIVDVFNNLVPPGVPGELCIAGVGLALGYNNNRQLTQEKFVDNPFEIGTRMYKTGDLTRWLPDGTIEYLGRMDHQVKIRGFRIELAEIEASLLQLEGIQAAIVLDKEQEGTKYLVAYYVAHQSYTIGELRGAIKKTLPEYMVPSYFIGLTSLPLLSSGKIDRKALPEVTGDVVVRGEYVALQTEEEKMLASVWQDVLKLKQIGGSDDFFHLGGDSIKAIQIVSRVRSKGYSIEVKDIFRSLTIRELSKQIKKAAPSKDQALVQGQVALTPIQQWFFAKVLLNQSHWNQAVMLFNAARFDEELLRMVLAKVVSHHDALRMVYSITLDPLGQQEICQINRGLEEPSFDLEVYDLREEVTDDEGTIISKICNTIQASIDLKDGPLLKAGLFKAREGDHLLLAIHHLVVDGVSWRILFEDLAIGYELASRGEEISFPPKSTSFKTWSEELVKYASSTRMQKHRAYWQQSNQWVVRPLPKDATPEKIPLRKTIAVKTSILSVEETEMLLKKANVAYNTGTNDLLITTLVKALTAFTHENTVLLNIEGHGREEIVKGVDVSRTVGWFTTQYPALFTCDSQIDLPDLLKEVKDNLRRIPEKGIGYGLLTYLQENQEAALPYIQPDICFNYLGQFDADIRTGIFQHSPLDIGASLSPEGQVIYALDITGIVVGDRLQLSILYSRENYAEKTIEHLLAAMQEHLRSLIHHCMNKEQPEVTAADLTQEAITLRELQPYATELHTIQAIKKLSSMQKGMLFHSMLDEQSSAYHESLVICLEGEIDRSLFERAFAALIQRYEILRTNFDYETFRESVQIVYKTREIKVDYRELCEEPADPRAFYQDEIHQERQKGFDLRKGALIRLKLIKTGNRKYILILSNHHILMDGWCMGLVLSDLFKLYHLFKAGHLITLKEVITSQPYIEWLQSRDEEHARTYWRHYLQGLHKKTLIPFENLHGSSGHEEYSMTIAVEAVRRLEEIAQNYRVTMNALLQTIWAIQLQKYNNTLDVVFGYIVSGRNPEVEGIESMIGLFINALPLRVTSTSNMTFGELLKRVHTDTLLSQEYDYYSLADIQALSELKNTLISSLMVFENYPLDVNEINQDLAQAGLTVIDFQAIEQTNYDLNLIISYDQEIHIKFIFNKEVYARESIEMVGKHFSNIISEISTNEAISIGNIDIVQDTLKAQEVEKVLAREVADSLHTIEFSF